MFERTKSFWQRLIHGQARAQAGEGATVEELDRRVFVRHPIDLPTTYQAGGGSKATRLAARLRNLSLGGVNLEVDQPFEPGELLSVELPGPDERTTTEALACVVHVRRLAEHRWSVGCTFSRELSEADLQAFGAHKQRTEPHDPRVWQRFPGKLQATYHTVGTSPSEPHAAQVFNISPCGVGLLVEEGVDNGTLLSVELRSADAKAQRVMLACVVHVTSRADGRWALGCNFIRSLSESELQALL